MSHDPLAQTACLVCGGLDLVAFDTRARWRIVSCGSCTHRQLAPIPAPEILASLYDEGYFTGGVAQGGYVDYARNALGWRRTARRRLADLRPFRGGARLLDVGAACGYFVAEAHQAGLAAEGVEFSGWAAAWAREHLKAPVQTGTIADVPTTPAFDVITAWEVIEHVTNPVEFVQNVTSRLAPNGIFALSTPDYASTVSRILGRRWMGWDKVPEHVSFFSRRSLTHLLERHGFRIERTGYVSTHVSVDYFANRLSVQLTGRSPLMRVPFVGSLTVPVNPGWDLAVTARLLR